jgi:Holliday junction resolvasome RuvABC endonuclease subunit
MADEAAWRRPVILGVDPGYANCGWAVVDRSARVVDLGVILTEQDDGVAKSTDRARRTRHVSAELVAIARRHNCKAIAAEQALQHGAAAAIAANLLPWGALIGIAVALGLELYEVPAKTWQHAVTDSPTKIAYEDLAKALAQYAALDCREALAAIAKKKRTHALDGMGVGVFAALRPATSITKGST